MQQKRQLVGRVTPPAKEPLPVDENGKIIDPIRPRCGAHSRRTGKPCMNWAMPNGRCRMHGGKNTGARTPHKAFNNKNAMRLGLYTEAMYPDEQDIYGTIEIGSLQDEIKMVRLLLRRAMRAQFLWEVVRGDIARSPDGTVRDAMLASGLWDIEELVTETGISGYDKDGVPLEIDKSKIVRRKTDFHDEIRQYARLLHRLEGQHQQLQEEKADEDTVARLAEDLRMFTDNMAATLPGGKMGG